MAKKTKKKTEAKVDKAAQDEALAQWFRDNPGPTFTHEAFGQSWEMPAEIKGELWFWRSELIEEGRSLDELNAAELDRFIRLVIPADVFDVWIAANVPLPALILEAGKVYLYQAGHRDSTEAA